MITSLAAKPPTKAIFVRQSIYEELKGFRPLWICEDFDFSRRLKKYANHSPLETSPNVGQFLSSFILLT